MDDIKDIKDSILRLTDKIEHNHAAVFRSISRIDVSMTEIKTYQTVGQKEIDDCKTYRDLNEIDKDKTKNTLTEVQTNQGMLLKGLTFITVLIVGICSRIIYKMFH